MKHSKVKEAAEKEGCRLEQLGNMEVFYCKEHTGVEQTGDNEINEMVDEKMNK